MRNVYDRKSEKESCRFLEEANGCVKTRRRRTLRELHRHLFVFFPAKNGEVVVSRVRLDVLCSTQPRRMLLQLWARHLSRGCCQRLVQVALQEERLVGLEVSDLLGPRGGVEEDWRRREEEVSPTPRHSQLLVRGPTSPRWALSYSSSSNRPKASQ